MSSALLKGLSKVEDSPFSGWKTIRGLEQTCSAPEDDEVCLLEDRPACNSNQNSLSDKRCLSEGHRSPTDFKVSESQYKIPKKAIDLKSSDSSFDGKYLTSPKKCHSAERPANSMLTLCLRNKSNAHDNKIGYMILRQGRPLSHPRNNALSREGLCSSLGGLTSPRSSGQRYSSEPVNVKQKAVQQNPKPWSPKSRWKHTHAPGSLSSLQSVSSWSQEMDNSSQELCSDFGGRSNDCEDTNVPEMNEETNSWSSCLKQEQELNRSIVDKILQGKEISINKNVDHEKNIVTDHEADAPVTSDTDSEREVVRGKVAYEASKQESSEDFDDCFSETCVKCLNRLSKGKKCLACNRRSFPSQAATPRKHLPPWRFYANGENPLKTKRTYSNRRFPENSTPVLLTGSKVKATSIGMDIEYQSQSNIVKKKAPGTPKRAKGFLSDESDSDFKPQQKRQCKGKPKTNPEPVVITLSDEDEENKDETAERNITGFQSPANNSTASSVIPETPTSGDDNDSQDSKETDSVNLASCLETPKSEIKDRGKARKKQKHKRVAENVSCYERDSLEMEIPLGKKVNIGTLACTAPEPLKITCCNDTIKFIVEYGTTNLPICITGKDLEYFKTSSGLRPDVIVLGVTSGFALKLRERIQAKGKFFDPGSAVAAEKDIVLETGECMKPEKVADIMEWVQDKLSKTFVELSANEVKKILSYQASAPTATERHIQAPVITQTKCYNTRRSSNKQQTSAVVSQRLIIYPPPPQPGGIAVTTEDVACLAPGEFLNDVIIDFYLKYVYHNTLKPEDKERTHILSSFFYKRLTQKNSNSSAEGLTSAERMYSNVRTWTKNVEIFDKDFVVVPINESSHWYLAVICFAGHDGLFLANGMTDEDEETDSSNIKSDTDDNDTGIDASEEDDDLDDLALSQIKKKDERTRKISIKARPCILVFDSLGNTRTRCMVNLRNYLTCEWRERRKDKEPREFTKDSLKGYLPKVPQQDNFCDCGVFVLQYMESFFEDAITDFTRPIKKPQWFSLDKISKKRSDIRKLIYHLKEAAEAGNS